MNGKDPDADLLSMLAHGSHAHRSNALGALMERHLSSIKTMAWYMLRDEMRAEDIAQEVFLRAWQHAPLWQAGRARFSTWMHRVAKNLCYDILRKKTELLGKDMPQMQDTHPHAQDLLIDKERRAYTKQQVIRAMNTLPKRQKMAITLCHYQGKSQIEAAQILEINVRAYESLLARGRQNLRAALSVHKKQLLEP